MNFKNICLVLMTLFIISCEEDTLEVFDHAGQYVIEKPIIDEYLDTHYYDDVDKEIKEIVEDTDEDVKSLSNDEALQAIETTYNDVDYTMYAYVYEEGSQENPDSDDTLNIGYRASGLDGTVYDESELTNTFLNLSSVIYGWTTGMVVFKGGIANEDDPTLPRQFTETGKGFMIIPSGLAYQNYGSGLIGPNETLIFKIELRTVIPAGEDLEE